MRKWTYERCAELAKTCKTKADFKKKNASAYAVARMHNWLKDFSWFVNGYKQERPWSRCRKKWNKEKVFELAKQCKSRGEFCKRFQSAYKVAVDEKWIDEWFDNKKAIYTHDKVLGLALTCKSRGDLQKKWPSAYNAARKHGWLEEFTWFEDHSHDFEYGRIYYIYRYLFSDGHVYVGLSRTNDRDVQHKRTRMENHGKISSVREYAEFLEQFKRTAECYGTNKIPNTLDIQCVRNIPFPKMEIMEKGLTASEAREREDFWVRWHGERGFHPLNKIKVGKNSGSLGACSRKWSRSRCYIEAKKFKSKGEFEKGSPSAYEKARKSGWLKDYDWMNFLSAQCQTIRNMTDKEYGDFVISVIHDFKTWNGPRYKLCQKYRISWNTLKRILISNNIKVPVIAHKSKGIDSK